MPRKRNRIQNNAELAALKLTLGAIGSLPFKASLRIGESVGRILAKTFPGLQRTALRNLEIALPELGAAEKRRIVRGVFESLGRHLGFVSHFRRFKSEDVRDLVDLVGRENFDAAYGRGKGVLFFTGHFGSWEVFNLLPRAFGFGMNILVRRVDNPLVESFVDAWRTRFGSVTIDKSRSARTMFRILKKGELLGILADLNVQEKEGVFVDFFGVPASTTTSIAKLALGTGAAILPAFAVWDDDKQKYVVHLEPEIEYDRDDASDGNVRRITQEITSVVEAYVRKYPDQWLWIHKRWNTRPPGEKLLY
jgi:KDO2-lipid IV(A) lauroyltransferase